MANPFDLIQVYQNEWAQDNPNLITIIVTQNNKVVGHMCAQLSQWPHGAAVGSPKYFSIVNCRQVFFLA